MDPLIQSTLPTLASHYKVEVEHLVDLLLSRETLVLQALTDFKKPGSLQELQRTLDKRDPRIDDLCQMLLTKIGELDTQKTVAKNLLAELQRMRAQLQRKYPEVIPTGG